MRLLKSLIQMPLLVAFAFSTIGSANEVRNGGQLVAVRFVARAWAILEYLETNQTRLLTDVQRLEFHTTLSTTLVAGVQGPLHSTDGLIVDARVVTDAAGKRTIELDQEKWAVIIEAPDSSMLVFHEYLRVLGLMDDHYEISSRLKYKPNGAPKLSPGVYLVNKDTGFMVMEDQTISGIEDYYWPFGYEVNMMGSTRSLRYRMNFPSFLRYSAADKGFVTVGRNVPVDYQCGENVGNAVFRPSPDGQTIEVLWSGMDQISGNCDAVGHSLRQTVAKRTILK